MFDYDWFHGGSYEQQKRDALLRVTLRKFPEQNRRSVLKDAQVKEFHNQLECRTLIYLRDGFSYEVKALCDDVGAKSQLVFESEPTDDAYKVGAFVVCVPFEEICRIEVFAVHVEHKPENKPMITGFRSAREDGREQL